MAKYYNSESEVIAAISAIELSEMGYLEKNRGQDLDKKQPGGSGNYTKYWRDIEPSYQGSAYCQGAQHWCLWKACGEDRALAKKVACVPDGENFSYYTPTQAGYFKSAKRWGTEPKVGAWIYFKNSVRIYHVEYVYKVTTTTVYTYGFNTSGTFNQVEANGDGCFPKSYSRTLSRIAGYGYPRYNLMVNASASATNPALHSTPIQSASDGLKVIVAAGALNIRDYPKTGKVIGSVANGARVFASEKVLFNGEPWFKIREGWISAKYLEGWVGENGKWWYVTVNYGWPVNTVKTIDGVQYTFDKNGYMVADTFTTINGKKGYIKPDGSLAKSEWIQIKNRWIYAKDDSTLAVNELYEIVSPTHGKEMYYFDKDCYMFTGVLTLKTNSRGALSIQ